MKVIDVYDKNNDLKSYNKNIFATTEAYLNKFPKEYRKCYDQNIDTLELIKVDKLPDKITTAMYNTDMNTIVFSSTNSLGHEMFHMASNDRVNGITSFDSAFDIERGLDEGITEYSFMKAYNLKQATGYPFEVFTVCMLEDIPNIFRPYFIPSWNDLMSLFPNKRDIYNLLYSLETYSNINMDNIAQSYTEEKFIIDKKEFRKSVKMVLESLIDIELSFEQNPQKLKAYRDKLLSLIAVNNIYYNMQELYPQYMNYAEKSTKRLIKE